MTQPQWPTPQGWGGQPVAPGQGWPAAAPPPAPAPAPRVGDHTPIVVGLIGIVAMVLCVFIVYLNYLQG